jgi:hypothetical protein
MTTADTQFPALTSLVSATTNVAELKAQLGAAYTPPGVTAGPTSEIRAMAVHHSTLAQIGHEADPWLKLVDDLADLADGGQVEGNDRAEYVRVVREHLDAARGRVEMRGESLARGLHGKAATDQQALSRHVHETYAQLADVRLILGLTHVLEVEPS